MKDDEKKGIMFFNTDKGLKPVAPIKKDASLGEIMVMKEMFGNKKDKPNAIMIDNELKWLE